MNKSNLNHPTQGVVFCCWDFVFAITKNTIKIDSYYSLLSIDDQRMRICPFCGWVYWDGVSQIKEKVPE